MKAMGNILAKRDGLIVLSLGASASHIALADESAGTIRDKTQLPGWSPESAEISALGESVRQWVRAHRAEGMRCRLALGASFFQVDTATLPSMSEADTASSVRFESLGRFGLEASEAVLQHLVIGESAAGREVALFAAPLQLVRKVAETVMEAGLMPEAIEHGALTAARGALQFEGAMRGELVACMHVEPTVATLTVWRGGRLCSIRPITGHWVTEPHALSGSSSDDPDSIPLEPVASCGWRWSALAEETLRSLRRACGESGWPACLAFSGEAAGESDLLRAVGGVCGLPTIAVDCGAWVHGAATHLGPAWAPMLGAANLVAAGSRVRRAA
jgi:hypothetical protein